MLAKRPSPHITLLDISTDTSRMSEHIGQHGQGILMSQPEPKAEAGVTVARVSERIRSRGGRHGAGRRHRSRGRRPKTTKVVGPGTKTITLTINGQPHKVNVESRMTLLEVLRNLLNLTGAKPISVDGSSGGSTVLVGGKPVSANTVLVLECVGKPIQTVESLGGTSSTPCRPRSSVTTPRSAVSALRASSWPSRRF